MGDDLVAPDDRTRLDWLGDHGCAWLQEAGLREVACPDLLALESAYAGEALRISPRLFVGDQPGGFAYGRVVRVDGGTAVQVLNLVLFPRLDSAMPILGCEILTFRKGVHLFVLDAYPLHAKRPLRCAQESLAGWRRQLSHAFELEETPQWGRAIFSDDVIIIKPGARRREPVTSFVPAVLGMLNSLGEPLCPVEGPRGRDEARRRRRLYLEEHATEEPAGPFLTRIAGAGWVEQFVGELLYPRWLWDADRLPPWGASSDHGATSLLELSKQEPR